MINWEDEINALEAEDLPEDGAGPPAMEMFKKGSKDTLRLDDMGKLTMLTTKVIMFDHDNGNTFTSTTASISDYGRHTLKDALALMQEIKKKKT